jgi:hypothetical protein
MQGLGRFRLRWDIWPTWLTTRVRLDAATFRLTRAQTTVVVDPTTGTATTSVVERLATQLEVSSRIFLDADMASVFGFVPGIYEGLDYMLLRHGGTAETTLLPVFGAGVHREAL